MVVHDEFSERYVLPYHTGKVRYRSGTQIEGALYHPQSCRFEHNGLLIFFPFCARLYSLGTNDLVFSNPDGSPLKPDCMTQAFTRITRAIGLHGVRFHDLRHTHATLMLWQGIHPKIVSERLGHSSVAITLDTYSHVLPGLQEAAALRFEESLRGTSIRVSTEVG